MTGGGIFRRFHNHRISGGNSRRDMMYDEVQWMVEGTDGDDRANRFMPGKRQPLCRFGIQSHGDFMPRIAAQTIDAMAYAVDGSRHFNTRILQRFAALLCSQSRKQWCLFLHELSRARENVYPLRFA
jgi:hypothetical protein